MVTSPSKRMDLESGISIGTSVSARHATSFILRMLEINPPIQLFFKEVCGMGRVLNYPNWHQNL
jgi:hypothetical protein